ncbi:tail tubular protein A [Vibrio phage JSF7]|uniref:Tail tubular protein A n=1 Tax=Vibrio phage JSF7 TaxID=1292086 RepID=A0A240EWW6_9CAUD|nr:tail protein [Vibrio phage JSF7]APD18159.1 tail tubular protein A [Vibrio phage JSF7]
MDKLTAVNNMLKMIGTRPVSSLSVRHPDVVDAEAALDDWTGRVCEIGWWFNKRMNITLARNLQKEVEVPDTYLGFLYTDRDTHHMYPYMTKLNNKMFNTEKNTFEFDMDLTLTWYVRVSWEELPIQAQQYVLYSAGADLVRDKIEDSYKEQSLRQDAERAFALLDAEQLRAAPVNILNSPYSKAMRSGRRPFHRNAF